LNAINNSAEDLQAAIAKENVIYGIIGSHFSIMKSEND